MYDSYHEARNLYHAYQGTVNDLLNEVEKDEPDQEVIEELKGDLDGFEMLSVECLEMIDGSEEVLKLLGVS